MIINQRIRKSTKVRVQGVVNAMPAERRVTRPKARTKDTMISLKTRKPLFGDSLRKDEKQPDAIIELDLQNSNSIKTTYSLNQSILDRLKDEGRPSFVVAERVDC